MYIERVQFTDYNGEHRDEEYCFNLNKTELMRLEATTEGGWSAHMERVMKAKDMPKLWKAIEDIVQMTYGVKSPDGRRFIKNQTVLDEFIQTEGYSELIMKYLNDTDAFVAMVNGAIPKDLAEQVKTMQQATPAKIADTASN